MQLLESTHDVQSALANFCRSGEMPQIKGANNRNLPHYRRLVRNIFNDNLTTAYPITHEFLSYDQWENLVDEFMILHASSSPQVWQMPRQLWEYVSSLDHPLVTQHAFLPELLWFEWLEVELYMMKDLRVSYRPEGDIYKDKLVINPEHSLQHFQWPVFLKSPRDINPDDKGHYFLVLYRNPETGSVRFMSLSPYMVRMIELLAEEPASMDEILANLSLEIHSVTTEDQNKEIEKFFKEMLEKKLILGFQR